MALGLGTGGTGGQGWPPSRRAACPLRIALCQSSGRGVHHGLNIMPAATQGLLSSPGVTSEPPFNAAKLHTMQR